MYQEVNYVEDAKGSSGVVGSGFPWCLPTPGGLKRDGMSVCTSLEL